MPNSVNLDISTRLDITCRKGDTFSLDVTVKDAAGVAVDVSASAFTFKMEVRASDTDVATIIASSDFSPVGDAQGSLVITATAGVMAAIASGMYVYDVQATAVSGSTVQTWFQGLFIVNEDVTV